jgi:hypothetical protein
MTAEPLESHLSVRFPADLAAAARQAAASDGLEVSAWIRREVEREAGRRAGRCHACGQAVPEAT